MSNRVTQKDLENVVDRINRITGNNIATHTRDKSGIRSNVGNYHLDYAYGGVRLVQYMNEHGGIRVIIDGFGTKRELYEKMHAFIAGIEAK